jgi:LPS export ABC transporter protein LptC
MKLNRTALGQIFVWVARNLSLVLLLSIYACQQSNPVKQRAETNQPKPTPSETRLILNNAILEQADDRGNSLWKIKARKSTYSQDRKKAYLEEITGNLFQDNQIVLQVSAKRGEVEQDGEVVFLKDNIIARDPRNNAQVRGDEVEWHPKQNLLTIRKNLVGTHSKLQVSATEGRYNTRTENLDLTGKIVATALEQKLQLQTEHLSWQVAQNKIVGDRSLQITRYQGQTVTDRIIADRGFVTLDNHLAHLQKNVELQSLKPLTQIATNSLVWNYDTRFVTSKEPVRVVNSQEQITVTGNQGEIDLDRQVAKLEGGVKGMSSRNQTKLYSNQLTWQMTTQIVEAMGNVIYEQNDPQLNLTGDRAVGTLQNNSVAVTSNGKQSVVTNIVP